MSETIKQSIKEETWRIQKKIKQENKKLADRIIEEMEVMEDEQRSIGFDEWWELKKIIKELVNGGM